MSSVTYRKPLDLFLKWANDHEWCLIETREYDDRTLAYLYVTPNGYHITVSVVDSMVDRITPWNGFISNAV